MCVCVVNKPLDSDKMFASEYNKDVGKNNTSLVKSAEAM